MWRNVVKWWWCVINATPQVWAGHSIYIIIITSSYVGVALKWSVRLMSKTNRWCANTGRIIIIYKRLYDDGGWLLHNTWRMEDWPTMMQQREEDGRRWTRTNIFTYDVSIFAQETQRWTVWTNTNPNILTNLSLSLSCFIRLYRRIHFIRM